MAFPSSQSKPETLSEALSKVKDTAGRIKVLAQARKTASSASATKANDIVGYVQGLAADRAELTRLVATPGLSAYAATEYPALNISTEYTAMVAQIDATLAWVSSNFPKAASGEVLERKLAADGTLTVNTFSVASLSAFRSQLDLLMATID